MAPILNLSYFFSEMTGHFSLNQQGIDSESKSRLLSSDDNGLASLVPYLTQGY